MLAALIVSLGANGALLVEVFGGRIWRTLNGSEKSPDAVSLSAQFEILRRRYVRFYPVCYDGELQRVEGRLTDFARGWFLSYGLPTLVDRQGRIWVPPKYRWDLDTDDLFLNWSRHAVEAAYKQKHGTRTPPGLVFNMSNTCPFYRKWLTRAPTEK